jgi:hypothetical protein
VERGVIREALSQSLESTEYWQKSGAYYVPTFSSGTGRKSKRIAYWKSFGFLYALHFRYYGSNVHDISPFLPIALVEGKNAMCLQEDFIGAFDPESACILHPWMQLKHDDPMPSGPFAMQHAINQFILAHCEEQVQIL